MSKTNGKKASVSDEIIVEFRIPRDVHARCVAAAREDGRSLSSMLRWIVREHVTPKKS